MKKGYIVIISVCSFIFLLLIAGAVMLLSSGVFHSIDDTADKARLDVFKSEARMALSLVKINMLEGLRGEDGDYIEFPFEGGVVKLELNSLAIVELDDLTFHESSYVLIREDGGDFSYSICFVDDEGIATGYADEVGAVEENDLNASNIIIVKNGEC